MRTSIILNMMMTIIIFSSSTEGSSQACRICQCVEDDVYGGELVKCSYLHLNRIPESIPVNATSLLLDGNNFTKTFKKMFRVFKKLRKLDLSFNNLFDLNEHTFVGLRNLRELDLSSNNLPLNESVYKQNLFAPLKHLMSLKINNNSNSYFLPSLTIYPDKSFQRLKSLQVLHLDGLPADFGPGLRSLVHLTNLSLSDSDGFCVLPILRNSTFRNVPYLKHLNVSNCLIVDTEHDTFTSLPNISVLDVSLNRDLGFDNFSKSTFGLRNSALKILKMNRLYPKFGSCSRMKVSHMINLQHTSLEEIHIEGNGIIELQQDLLTSMPETLNTMYAGSNRFAYGIYVIQLFEMKSLRNLYLTNTNGWHGDGPSSRTEPNQGYGYGFPVRVPIHIETFDISMSYFKGRIKSTESLNVSLKTFIANNNLIEGLEGSFQSFHKLEYLDLSHNIMTMFDRGSSVRFPSLKYCNISHNFLGNCFAKDIYGHVFRGLFGLEHLDIHSNDIEYLSNNAFEDMFSLKSLSLSHNKINTFDHRLRHMKHLQYLDLSFNMIGHLGKNVQMDLDYLQNVTINLASNVFSCTCANLDMFHWMLNYRSNIQGLESSRCKFDNGTFVKTSELKGIIDILNFQCTSYLVHFIAALSLFVMTVLVITIMLIYRYRWRLRYMYYVGRRANLTKDAELQYVFDGFVSYADEDRGFVKEEMIRELEEKSGLKLCIHDRDFIPGSVIASNITNAIQNSRKTLIILSQNFLKSDWCDYEFNMARTEGVTRRKNVIVAVRYSNVSHRSLTNDMASFLAQYSYIEFDPAGDTDLFWSSLVDAIKTDEPLD